MSLTPGSQIGSYEIQSLLGEGGMGQVYKARDSKLGRDVAIKVLPASVANDSERLARFEREAKLLASLSHTNIAQVYGLEQVSGSGYALVMELAPGEDLTLRIGRSAMALSDALPIAIQIANALEAAHERAIVHRDLKPANIKVSDDGAVKVLDFGLAKAFAAGEGNSAAAMNSPTLTAQATAAGVILGTAAYMSPEQARGREADKRADVWAFGVVFFEMLTGARLFQGETISDTLAAVLRQDIPWSTLPAGIPGEITRLLRRCLERDRKNRLHDIADARIVLEEVARGGAKDEVATVPTPAPSPVSRTRWLITAAGIVAGLALGFLGGRSTAPVVPSTTTATTVRLVIPTPPGITEVGQPAVAPDGSFVVFTGRSGAKGQQLYLQRLDESAPRAIPRTEGASEPVVSFDGRWIAFRRANRLARIAVDGGEPLDITAAGSGGPGAAWLPGGTIVFAEAWLNPLSAVSYEGGTVRQVSTLDTAKGEIGHWFPSRLPDARSVLITVWKKGAGLNDAEVAVLDTQSGRHQILFKGAEGRYIAPGFIMFFRAGAYHAVRFDPLTLKVEGDPVRVLDDAFGNLPEGDTPETDATVAGTLAYVSGPNRRVRQLTWISAGGKTDALPFQARAFLDASLTRDGKRAAVAVADAGRNVLRLLDLDQRTDDALDLPALSWYPAWHPDGKRLAFLSMRKGDFDVYWKDVTTSGPAEPLLVTAMDEMPEAFLPDGKTMIVRQSEPDGQYLPKLMSIDPIGAPKTLVTFAARNSTVSGDGQLVAFTSDRGGTSEVYVQPLTVGAAAERVSIGGGLAVAWSRDGRELLYLKPPEIIAVTFKVEGGRFRATGAERVWSRVEGDYADSLFEVGKDGRVLVAIAKEQVPREIRVIVNWQQEIAKKVK